MAASLSPVVYDPDAYTSAAGKWRLLGEAMALATAFTERHELAPWEFRNGETGHYGVYARSGARARIIVDVSRCRTPSRVPGFSWSWPGYKADLSVAGVLAHELGHHVWAEIHRACEDAEAWVGHLESWRQIHLHGVPVSSYEHDVEETFTESFKLFLLDPDLLRAGRPDRWELMLQSGLTPMHEAPWREVLKYAGEQRVAAAERWIERAGGQP